MIHLAPLVLLPGSGWSCSPTVIHCYLMIRPKVRTPNVSFHHHYGAKGTRKLISLGTLTAGQVGSDAAHSCNTAFQCRIQAQQQVRSSHRQSSCRVQASTEFICENSKRTVICLIVIGPLPLCWVSWRCGPNQHCHAVLSVVPCKQIGCWFSLLFLPECIVGLGRWLRQSIACRAGVKPRV